MSAHIHRPNGLGRKGRIDESLDKVLHVRISERDVERLNALAVLSRREVSSIVREVLLAHLDRHTRVER